MMKQLGLELMLWNWKKMKMCRAIHFYVSEIEWKPEGINNFLITVWLLFISEKKSQGQKEVACFLAVGHSNFLLTGRMWGMLEAHISKWESQEF